ncbi:MAG: hypothetical protein AAB438_00320 [Patescibacteria group bacterium]
MKNKQLILGLAVVFSLLSSSSLYAQGLKVNLDSSLSTKTEVESKNESDLNHSADTKTETDLKIDSSTSENGSVTNALGVSLNSGAEVEKDEELKVFSSSLMEKDSNVSSVKVSDNTESKQHVEVKYKYKAKLFGFIPVYVNSTNIVEVDKNSEVKVYSKLPWWNFLAKKENYNRADIEGRLRNNLTIKSITEADLSAETKAEIAEAIVYEVEASSKAIINTN